MDDELTFEEALGRVERIVEDLERGEPELSAALAKYERGVGLLAQCYGLLDRAERAVALLSGVDADGRPETEPFDATATAERADGPAAPCAAPPEDDDSLPF